MDKRETRFIPTSYPKYAQAGQELVCAWAVISALVGFAWTEPNLKFWPRDWKEPPGPAATQEGPAGNKPDFLGTDVVPT